MLRKFLRNKVLLILSTLALATPVFADLGHSRAEMEAKYGKEIHPDNVFDEATCYPESVKVNGVVIKRPVIYFTSYEDKAHDYQLFVLYNSRGVVTEVRYRHAKGGDITEEEFHSLMERNGFSIGRSLDEYRDWHGDTLEPLYPINNDRNCWLEVDWSPEKGKDDFEFPGEPAPKRPRVTGIRITTAEALADTAQNGRNWRLFKAAIDANPQVSEEVYRKMRAALNKDVNK